MWESILGITVRVGVDGVATVVFESSLVEVVIVVVVVVGAVAVVVAVVEVVVLSGSRGDDGSVIPSKLRSLIRLLLLLNMMLPRLEKESDFRKSSSRRLSVGMETSRGRNSEETVADSVLVLDRDLDQKWEDPLLALLESDGCLECLGGLGPILAEPLEPLEALDLAGDDPPRSRDSIGDVTECITSPKLFVLNRDVGVVDDCDCELGLFVSFFGVRGADCDCRFCLGVTDEGMDGEME